MRAEPEVGFAPTLEVPLTRLAEVFAQAFEGYFVPLPADPLALASRIRQEQIDLSASLLALGPAAEPVGVALIARRGEVSRLAGMGVVPAWRGRGVGAALVGRVLAEARSRGETGMRLEVITRNTAALRLYQQHGFVILRRLVGHQASAPERNPAPLEGVGIAEVVRELALHGESDLPWQLEPATLGALTPPVRGFRLGPAWALLSAGQEAVLLRALVVQGDQRRQGHGRRLLAALAAHFQGQRLVLPPIVPEALAEPFLLRCGFERGDLEQYEMRCTWAG